MKLGAKQTLDLKQADIYVARLLELGWLYENGKWRDHRGHRYLYNQQAAISMEQMRGGIRRKGRSWTL